MIYEAPVIIDAGSVSTADNGPTLRQTCDTIRREMAEAPEWLRVIYERNERIAARLRRERIARGQPP